MMQCSKLEVNPNFNYRSYLGYTSKESQITIRRIMAGSLNTYQILYFIQKLNCAIISAESLKDMALGNL